MELERRERDAKAGYDQGTWLVHHGKYPEIDVGMVSDGHGFEDSPDCEFVAGGVNSKGPYAVAIGRQANLLSWGFYGAPDRMTESSKRAFLNAIVWMRRFAGQVPVAKKEGRGRTWLRQHLETLERMEPAELAKQAKANEGMFVYLVRQFPAELRRDGAVDVAAMRRWYETNEEYFGPGADAYSCAVDPDLVAWKLSNRKPEFLDRLLAAFAKDPQDATALRLAQRYLGEHGKDATTARAFIEANREFLFFSDTAGFRWLVDVNAQRAKAKANGAAR